MGIIILHTKIQNTPEVCFDLSTSIDLHKISTQHTNEEAIAGIRTGLIKLNESVTWRAKHFGLWFELTTAITTYDRPNYFVDEMTSGPFKMMKHEHIFKEQNGFTIMTDKFIFLSPFGFLGIAADKMILENYLRKLLIKRNETIKDFAETTKWRDITENKSDDQK